MQTDDTIDILDNNETKTKTKKLSADDKTSAYIGVIGVSASVFLMILSYSMPRIRYRDYGLERTIDRKKRKDKEKKRAKEKKEAEEKERRRR